MKAPDFAMSLRARIDRTAAKCFGGTRRRCGVRLGLLGKTPGADVGVTLKAYRDYRQRYIHDRSRILKPHQHVNDHS